MRESLRGPLLRIMGQSPEYGPEGELRLRIVLECGHSDHRPAGRPVPARSHCSKCLIEGQVRAGSLLAAKHHKVQCGGPVVCPKHCKHCVDLEHHWVKRISDTAQKVWRCKHCSAWCMISETDTLDTGPQVWLREVGRLKS